MDAWELVYYETNNGRCPVREYLDSLSAHEAARVAFDLDLLQEFGITLGAPHVRSVRGKLWELRTGGRIQHRVFYAALRGRQLILLHAFTKKSARTPPSEIAIAENRLSDYLSRSDS